MESKQPECNNFVPQKQIPCLDTINDHTDLQSKWQDKVRKDWEDFIPAVTNTVQSSLVVVFPNDDWIINGTHEMKCFLYAPRKNQPVESIDSQWQDKKLVEFMHQLWDNLVVTALVLTSEQHVALFEEYPQLHSYCMMNSKASAREDIKSAREDIIQNMHNLKVISLNGLKDIDKNEASRGYLIHLQLDSDFTPHIPAAPFKDSNFFVWLSVTKVDAISESILITNCYVWNTFMDIAWKHDRSLSADYNLNINKIDDYYNSAHKIEMKSNERFSYVSPNQMIEMDTLWNNFIRNKWKEESELMSVSMERAVGVLVANCHYERFWKNYFPIDKFGFQKLYIHYYDKYKSFKNRYEDSKRKYLPLFVAMKVSCNSNLFENIAPSSTKQIENIFQKLGGSSTHFWLWQRLNYSHMVDNINVKITKYMKDLQRDFKLKQISDAKDINRLYELLNSFFPQHLLNKWCLSLYFGADCGYISRLYIDEFKPRLCFGNGFELMLIYQANDFPVVLVNEFMWQCKSSCTAIQFHARDDLKLIKKGIRVKGWNDSTVVVLLRVVPVVHSEDGLLMYNDDDCGKLCQRHNECGWKPSALNK